MRNVVCWVMAWSLLCAFTVGEDVVVKGKVKALKSGQKILFRPDGATTSVTIPETSAWAKSTPQKVLQALTACIMAGGAGCGMVFQGVLNSGTAATPSVVIPPEVAQDTTPPTGSWTAPNADATVSGSTVTLTVTAADNVGVVGVQFKVDGVNVGSEDILSPYSIVWDSTTVTSATHTLSAFIRDAHGNNVTPTRSITVNNATGTVIEFSSSASSTQAGGATQETLEFTMPPGSEGVVCGACMLEDATAADMTMTSVIYAGTPMTFAKSQAVPLESQSNRMEAWCLVNPPTGTNDMVFAFTGSVTSIVCGAQSAINAKQEQPHAAVSTFVDGGASASVISQAITTDTDNELVMEFVGSGAAESTVTPNSGQTERFDTTHTPGPGAQMAASTKLIASAGTQTHQWTSSDTARMGLIILALRDSDASSPGDTTPPAVSMTAPSQNATVSGTSTTVSATCTDAVGVVGVQFKLDGTNLGSEDTGSPYSITWDTTTASDGAHVLTATCRDAVPNSATTSDRNVTVDNGGSVATDGPEQPLWGGNEVSRWAALASANAPVWQTLLAQAGASTGSGKPVNQTGAESAMPGGWQAIAYRATGASGYLASGIAHNEFYWSGGVLTGADSTRERLPQMGYVYYFLSPGMTSTQRTDMINRTNTAIEFCIDRWNSGAFMDFDTDQLAGCGAGIVMFNRAILDDGRATAGQQTTAQAYLNDASVNEMMERLEDYINDSGGMWMEGSNYNRGTNQFLMMLAAQFDDADLGITGLDAYANSACRQEVLDMTYDREQSEHWGDVDQSVVGTLVGFRRVPFNWTCTSLAGSDGTNARFAAETVSTNLGNAANWMGGNYGAPGFLMQRADRAATSYSMTGNHVMGQGIFEKHTSSTSFFTQSQPATPNIWPQDHEVYPISSWSFYKNGAFMVPEEWGYDTGGNEASIRWGVYNSTLVDGQPSMYESRGILARDTDGPCYGQGANTVGNRYQNGQPGPNRWIHNWEEWTLHCPAGASGIDVVVHFTSVFKETAPTTGLLTRDNNKRLEYPQYYQRVLAGNTPTVNDTTDSATWSVDGISNRLTWHLPTAANMSSDGNHVEMEPTTPASRQFMLYTLNSGGNATETWNGTTLTIARAGESDVICTPNLSNRQTTPSTTFDGNNKVQAVQNLFQTYGFTNGFVCTN